jgi:hypothetical protein
MGGAEAEAPHLKGGAIVTVMITVAAAVGGVEAAGMTGLMMEVAGMTGMMMEGAEAAGMTGMMMEEDAGMVAHPQGVGGAQSGRAARNAGPRLSSGTVNAKQSSESLWQVPQAEHCWLGFLLVGYSYVLSGPVLVDILLG